MLSCDLKFNTIMKKIDRFLLILLLSACSPGMKISVTNVNDVSSIHNSTYVYALPLSAFTVTVVAQQESCVPGPYFMFAQKYLGISDVITKPYDNWAIKDIKITCYTETDPDFVYTVNSNKESFCLQWLQELSNEKLILLPGSFANRGVFENALDLKSSGVTYTDLSIKPIFDMEKRTLISEKLPDTLFFTLADSKDKDAPVLKTIEQKAEEAANFILKIWKRRFKLISGQYTFMPDGEALDRAIEELNRIEANYLSLFTGQKKVTSHTRTFHYVPEDTEDISRAILLRFSDSDGFLDAGEANGKPVLVDIQDMNKTKGLDAIKLNDEESGNQVFYRIPDQGHLKVIYGEQVIEEAYYPVYQFGTLVSMRLSGERRK
jgi:hypothetical protein